MQLRRVNVDCEAKTFISALFSLAIVKQNNEKKGEEIVTFKLQFSS